MKFGERLRQVRREQGLTLQEVADRLGVRLQCVSKVELKTKTWNAARTARFARALGVTVEHLEKGKE